MDEYWKDLVSTALRVLQENKNADAVSVIKNGALVVELNNHDNWDGGIDYWNIVFQLKYRDFKVLEIRKEAIEGALWAVLDRYNTDERNRITKVIVRLLVERFVDWQAALPARDEKKDIRDPDSI